MNEPIVEPLFAVESESAFQTNAPLIPRDSVAGRALVVVIERGFLGEVARAKVVPAIHDVVWAFAQREQVGYKIHKNLLRLVVGSVRRQRGKVVLHLQEKIENLGLMVQLFRRRKTLAQQIEIGEQSHRGAFRDRS